MLSKACLWLRQYSLSFNALLWQAAHFFVVMEGLFRVWILRVITTSCLPLLQKLYGLVQEGTWYFFFALASGMINAIIEGRNLSGFVLPTRSAQTVGETVVITLILFIGMVGTFML